MYFFLLVFFFLSIPFVAITLWRGVVAATPTLLPSPSLARYPFASCVRDVPSKRHEEFQWDNQFFFPFPFVITHVSAGVTTAAAESGGVTRVITWLLEFTAQTSSKNVKLRFRFRRRNRTELRACFK